MFYTIHKIFGNTNVWNFDFLENDWNDSIWLENFSAIAE